MAFRTAPPPCPKCQSELGSAESAGVPYAHCAKCRGLWLGADGLKVLLARRGARSAAELVALLDAGFAKPTQRPCVGCRKPLLARRLLEIEIDYCPDCKGVFLDDGEFDQVLMADATFDPSGGMPSDSDRLLRAFDCVVNEHSRYNLWGDERD
jgi:Zn-finger nucleic acid-binding protein